MIIYMHDSRSIHSREKRLTRSRVSIQQAKRTHVVFLQSPNRLLLHFSLFRHCFPASILRAFAFLICGSNFVCRSPNSVHLCEQSCPPSIFFIAIHEKLARLVIQRRFWERNDEQAANDLIQHEIASLKTVQTVYRMFSWMRYTPGEREKESRQRSSRA